MCGDHVLIFFYPLTAMGSPPHVRGPPSTCFFNSARIGITPACAGTTYIKKAPFKVLRDHPRMCGDHLKFQKIAVHPLGSPPHVRGPRITDMLIDYMKGITPACAGTTLSRTSLLN